jgi:hypothetical protein
MMGRRAGSRPLASIAAMPKRLRPIILALILAGGTTALAGCGNSGPSPSIPAADATTLIGKIEEIRANVDNGSCLVAADRTDDLIADINNLPSSVDSSVKEALNSGANNLKLLLSDPSKCAGRTTSTTTPSTTESTSSTESTTTTKTRPTTTTTPTQTGPSTTTQTQTTPTNPSGGVGPGSPGGL